MNLQILIGRLGSDPVVHVFDNGNKNCKFPLATSYSYKDNDGNWQKQTDWHNIVVSGPIVSYIEKHFKKGSKASIQGRTRNREYTTSEGEKRYVTEVMASRVNLEENHQTTTQANTPSATGSNEPDDLPF